MPTEDKGLEEGMMPVGERADRWAALVPGKKKDYVLERVRIHVECRGWDPVSRSRKLGIRVTGRVALEAGQSSQ